MISRVAGFKLTLRTFSSASMTSSECFSALGLSFGCSEDQIKEAYRKLAKLHHPDLGGSAERFVKIQKAYENLMDPSNRKKANPAGSSSSNQQSQYWKSWNTGGTWWGSAGSSGSSYSSDKDFEADFEEQWRKFTERKSKQRGRKFRARRDFAESEDSDDGETFETRDESYRSEKSDRSSSGRQSRRSQKKSPNSEPAPNKVKVSLEKGEGLLTGEYERIAKFNGRMCYRSSASLFMFWSNKNKDWKISESLKDDGNCLAFNDRVHPSIDCPFIIGDSSKWMMWSDRAKRFLPTKICFNLVPEDYSSWSVERLRDRLEALGLKEKADRCFEKAELVELMTLFGKTSRDSRKEPRDFSADAPIPEGLYRLCSRQRHDGVVQAPPVLSERCLVGKNRIERFMGKLESVEEWLLKHGDRKRYYGVFDSEKQFCFGLIWKNNKVWARAAPHDW